MGTFSRRMYFHCLCTYTFCGSQSYDVLVQCFVFCTRAKTTHILCIHILALLIARVSTKGCVMVVHSTVISWVRHLLRLLRTHVSDELVHRRYFR